MKRKTLEEIKNLNLAELANYIENFHHVFVRENLPKIEEKLAKIIAIHGQNHKELTEIQANFFSIRDELLTHLPKEENILFPYIQKLINAEKAGIIPPKPHFGTIKNPIRVMESEHDDATDAFAKIHTLTNNFSLPPDACEAYKITFEILKNFEDDLKMHIYLENEILFPGAISLEEKIFTK